MTRRAIVAGGGIAGLSATLALRQAGWDIAAFERAPVHLSLALAPRALD